MMYVIFIIASLALLAGFVVLHGCESRRGTRYFSRERSQLDVWVLRVAFMYAHVDFSTFARSEFRRFIGHAGHAAATATLTFVRAAERLLTRMVRTLRTRHAIEAGPRVSARQFVRTLSEFKGQLNVTRPVREQTVRIG